MKIQDKSGNHLQLEARDGKIKVELVTPTYCLVLGVIDRAQRTFILDWDNCKVSRNWIPHYAISGKFLSEASTFDFVDIAGEKFKLLDLKFHLLIPPGSYFESFSEMVYFDTTTDVPPFKDKYEAMLFYIDLYAHRFSHGDLPECPFKLDRCHTFLDLNIFISNSISTIRNYANTKSGTIPYFLHLTQLYKYLKQKDYDGNHK